MGRRVTRGEIWLGQAGSKTRPVLVLTRPEVIDVRRMVTVAEVTTTIRGLHAEVEFDHARAGLRRASVVNCDGLHTVLKSSLTSRLGTLDEFTMRRVCRAVRYALAC